MKLGMQVGLDLGHIVLDGDPGPRPRAKGAQQPPLFGPCLYRAVASGVLGGAEHPRAAGAAPVLRMARSTPS